MNDARLCHFGVAYLAGLVDLLAGETEVTDGRWPGVLFGNTRMRLIGSKLRNLTPRLRRIVFVGKASLRTSFDLQRLCLCMHDGGGPRGKLETPVSRKRIRQICRILRPVRRSRLSCNLPQICGRSVNREAARVAGLKPGGQPKNEPANLPVQQTQPEAARSLNVSERLMRSAKKIEEQTSSH